MTDATSLALLDHEPFVSLSTFRHSGEPVATTVWIVRDGDALYVTTGESTGKVRRVRRDPRVTMRPCTRLGRVGEGAPSVSGVAEVVTDPAVTERVMAAFRAKYRMQFRLAMALERFRKKGGTRILLRITPG
ncbi:PPOX class F420-dependent oxidoreductase [Actinopolymorpha sp. NPDC004070]|uniref:PPOX class F420-dependent oxidoreductase n=1 Tax=Actinopolymorpha sp. NPDC004070 TaxID=3154548 RepID=UPI0033B485FB